MRTKVNRSSSELRLSRVLDGLAEELTLASDPEIAAAARDLGMDLSMKGSVAFAGIHFPARPEVADFFDLDEIRRLHARQGTISKDTPDEET